MKLKLWAEVLLIIIAIASSILITFDVEISMIPFILGTIILTSCVAILDEYGRLFNILKVKLDYFLCK